jgi:hypothetical protein
MFDLWRVKRKQRKAEQEYRAEFERLRKEKKGASDEYNRLCYEESETLIYFDKEIDGLLSQRIVREARDLDVEMPSSEDRKFWQIHEENQVVYLSSYGRSYLRKLIDEEKTRRFEVTTRWIKLIAMLAPVLGAAAGVIGALIGWVAIHKK